MKPWLCAIVIALSQLGDMCFQAQATTFDLPLNGEFKISGDIGVPLWATFLVTANSAVSEQPLSESPDPSGSGWVSNITLTQSNDLGGFSAPQVCSAAGNCFLLSNFLACGGSLGCTETNAVGSGYLRNGMPAPILVSEATNIFSIATSVSVNVPVDLELSVDLPDGLWIELLQGPALRNAEIVSPAAEAPNPATLPLFATGLLILGLVASRQKVSQSLQKSVGRF